MERLSRIWGTYDPLESNNEKQVTLKKDRVEYWLSVGAKPTESVASVLKNLVSHSRNKI